MKPWLLVVSAVKCTDKDYRLINNEFYRDFTTPNAILYGLIQIDSKLIANWSQIHSELIVNWL